MKPRPAYLALIATILAAAAVLAIAVGCGSAPGTVTLGESDDGSAVDLEPKQELVISLPGNPTTGFSWAVIDVDDSVLAPIGEPEYLPDSTDATLVGGGGMYTLRFEAVATGDTELRLAYARTWETDVEPEDSFTVNVNVR